MVYRRWTVVTVVWRKMPCWVGGHRLVGNHVFTILMITNHPQKLFFSTPTASMVQFGKIPMIEKIKCHSDPCSSSRKRWPFAGSVRLQSLLIRSGQLDSYVCENTCCGFCLNNKVHVFELITAMNQLSLFVGLRTFTEPGNQNSLGEQSSFFTNKTLQQGWQSHFLCVHGPVGSQRI